MHIPHKVKAFNSQGVPSTFNNQAPKKSSLEITLNNLFISVKFKVIFLFTSITHKKREFNGGFVGNSK